tara:strand:+ start:501 stop:800 length:300 start_codon:yes stop_codon:yes gene_type:complete
MLLTLLYLTSCTHLHFQVTNIEDRTKPNPSPTEYWDLVEETARLQRECEELVLIQNRGIYSREFFALRSSYNLDLIETYGKWGLIPEELSDCLDVINSP